VAGEIDPVRVVDDAIEDGVGKGWVADQFMPFVDGSEKANERALRWSLCRGAGGRCCRRTAEQRDELAAPE